ncbi:MAG: DUF2961 domain-containing protein [Candidatus Lokiarchaeota archaeon]|nr:DUF2961 domain-containing protein [Candidatus Lokiarchaeota archaeon]
MTHKSIAGEFDPSVKLMLHDLSMLKTGKTRRISSWDVTGRNADSWHIKPGETRVLADIKGPGCITHIWMTQSNHYREVLLKFTWDDAPAPSIIVPLGDFFCLGHGIVNSFQSALFTASTNANNRFNAGCALNCYVPMPFKKRALVELVNESKEEHNQYFYVDYETHEDPFDGRGYFHAEFHRENPFGGWGHEIIVNTPESNIPNKERLAWENNFVILETKGKGHFIGFNLSITNFQGTWWGEGDDMIWVDGYKWPPDLHGTGSEDALNQAWGMQRNAFLRNGSSIYEPDTGGYQSSYVFYIENPVRFTREIKATIEHGHANHLRNEVSSVAYWYAEVPAAVKQPPPVEKRMPVLKVDGKWIHDPKNQITSRDVPLTDEMIKSKRRWKAKDLGGYVNVSGKACVDEDGLACIEMKIARDNPELYQISLGELFEEFVHKPATVEIMAGGAKQKHAGVLMLLSNGELAIESPPEKEGSCGTSTTFREMLGMMIGKAVDVEAIGDLDSVDEKSGMPKNFVITIQQQ